MNIVYTDNQELKFHKESILDYIDSIIFDYKLNLEAGDKIMDIDDIEVLFDYIKTTYPDYDLKE